MKHYAIGALLPDCWQALARRLPAIPHTKPIMACLQNYVRDKKLAAVAAGFLFYVIRGKNQRNETDLFFINTEGPSAQPL